MSSVPISVLVIDENQIRASIIEAGLFEAGYQKVSIVNELNGIARNIERIQPDVIVIDLENPNRDMLESLFALTRSIERPIAMFVDKSDIQSTEAAIDAGVSAYVIDGMKKERVKPVLEMAISRFKAFRRMQKELEDVKSELQNRKIIDQAKAILMKSKKISEEEAYHLLRSTAMNQNQKMSDIAQSLVTASKLLGPLG